MKYILALSSALLLSCSSEDKGSNIGKKPSSNVLRVNSTTAQIETKENYDKKIIDFAYKPIYSPININKLSNVELKKLYSDLLLQDQQYRDSLHVAGISEKQKGLYWKEIDRADSINQLTLSALVHKFGWPTVKDHGKESVKAAFYITWHAGIEYKKRHITLFEKGSKVDTLNFHYFKLIKDYVLLWEGKEQQFNTHTRLANGTYQIDF